MNYDAIHREIEQRRTPAYMREVPFIRFERVLLYFLVVNWLWDFVAGIADKIANGG